MNGILTPINNNTEVRIDTLLFSGFNKKSDCSIVITKQTSICACRKSPERCVVFLPSEHIIINESYLEIKKLIRNLQ